MDVDQQVARLRQNIVESEGVGSEAQLESKCVRGRAYSDEDIAAV